MTENGVSKAVETSELVLNGTAREAQCPSRHEPSPERRPSLGPSDGQSVFSAHNSLRTLPPLKSIIDGPGSTTVALEPKDPHLCRRPDRMQPAPQRLTAELPLPLGSAPPQVAIYPTSPEAQQSNWARRIACSPAGKEPFHTSSTVRGDRALQPLGTVAASTLRRQHPLTAEKTSRCSVIFNGCVKPIECRVAERSASPEADKKRKRNAQASVRFRERRKLEWRELAQAHRLKAEENATLQQENKRLEQELAALRAENKALQGRLMSLEQHITTSDSVRSMWE